MIQRLGDVLRLIPMGKMPDDMPDADSSRPHRIQPIFHSQARNPAKFADVVGCHDRPQRQSMGCDQRIQRSNRRTQRL